ncbi:MAG: sulfite exporter TauE/SafE family protein [Hyphomicrobiales bacterium]|nr:sulfite exporter TauE/SafE family protein [Hyphomicrobiales bacterium]MDE2114539.1 sulfite exporter TauE/SafE family protein [Hyphomicrobiales bacterium]
MLSHTDFLSLGSGSIVGFTLGLIGGGGSIMALPLLLYVVGMKDPHMAIGTSALAVAASAFGNLLGHARGGRVKWNCALAFAGSGIVGAYAGSTLGKHFDGQKLLTLFGVLMIIIAANMLRPRKGEDAHDVKLHMGSVSSLLPPLVLFGFVVGALSGFFGIGGGFLVVPGLVAATSMPLIMAIGSSLVSVTAFGLTTAFNYSLSGLVDWHVATFFILGGIVGGLFGGALAARLATKKQLLSRVFATIVAVVGVYVIYKSLHTA